MKASDDGFHLMSSLTFEGIIDPIRCVCFHEVTLEVLNYRFFTFYFCIFFKANNTLTGNLLAPMCLWKGSDAQLFMQYGRTIIAQLLYPC